MRHVSIVLLVAVVSVIWVVSAKRVVPPSTSKLVMGSSVEVDLGVIEVGASKKTKLSAFNSGSTSVKIVDVQTSCGCVEVIDCPAEIAACGAVDITIAGDGTRSTGATLYTVAVAFCYSARRDYLVAPSPVDSRRSSAGYQRFRGRSTSLMVHATRRFGIQFERLDRYLKQRTTDPCVNDLARKVPKWRRDLQPACNGVFES